MVVENLRVECGGERKETGWKHGIGQREREGLASEK